MQTIMSDRLWGLFEPYLAAEQIELDDLTVQGSGKSATLKVVVDAPGGIDLDRISDLSHHLSRLLDHQTEITGPYNLEVTSPGLERKLTRPTHFQKARGREVVLKLVEGEGSCRGTLQSANDQEVVINLEEGGCRSIPYVRIGEARTIFRWGPTKSKEKK